MVLNDLILKTRSNQNWKYSGLDCLEECIDKNHFLNYPYEVNYNFNSRGFRDSEWTDDLKQSVWCIGDSFTVGLGQPYNHIWPQVLQNNIKKRTINISMDGASNDWISRRTKKIIEEVNPKNIIVMWSYLHRREDININLSDEDRRLYWLEETNTDIDDYLHWQKQVKELPKDVIQFAIPKFSSDKNHSHRVIEVPQLDFARDGHHFDIKTSQWIVDKLQSHFL